MKLKNAKIYKITGGSKAYIGSTTKTLNKRLKLHKYSYNRYLNGIGNNVTSFEIIKHNDCKIELIENFPCETKKELHERERYYIETIDCVNKVIPNRTSKQYYQDNRDKMKEYYQDNRDKRLDQMKQYYLDNRDRIKQYRQDKFWVDFQPQPKIKLIIKPKQIISN